MEKYLLWKNNMSNCQHCCQGKFIFQLLTLKPRDVECQNERMILCCLIHREKSLTPPPELMILPLSFSVVINILPLLTYGNLLLKEHHSGPALKLLCKFFTQSQSLQVLIKPIQNPPLVGQVSYSM